MKMLVAFVLFFLLSCGENSTTFFENETPGWHNIGTLGQPLLRRTFDATPATTTYDFNNASQLAHTGPFMISLAGWVDTEDPDAGALLFDVNYNDPTGSTRFVNFGTSLVLLLNDDTSFFSTPVVTMVRESDTSLWELATTLAGVAEDALVHYEIMLHPTDQSDWSFFSDQ